MRCETCLTEGPRICDECILSLGEPPKSSCIVCNTLTLGNKLCTQCRSQNKIHTLTACYRYEARPEHVLHSYKFAGDRSLGWSIASAMNEACLPFEYDAVVVVPSSPARTRRRGFDHSALLGKHIAKHRKLPLISPLMRRGADRQVGSTRVQRFEQVNKQYAVSSNAALRLQDAHILLVDDVVTTGATLSRCATLMRRAGARRVDALVFARR